MEKIVLEEMTWVEVQEALNAGVDTVVLVAASTEQHGPHLPMGTDTFWGRALGERVARRLGNALLAPVIAVGCTEALMSFPGTITLNNDTLIATIVDYCRSLARHGFKNVVLITSHEGDLAPMEKAAQRIRRELPEINVVAFTDAQDTMRALCDTAAKGGIELEVAGYHAGEFETSVMMAVNSDFVAKDKMVMGILVDPSEWPGLFAGDFKELTAVGIAGDPRNASKEMGESYLDSLSGAIAEHVRARLARQAPYGRQNGFPSVR
jgi:creatinine amidohydrolase